MTTALKVMTSDSDVWNPRRQPSARVLNALLVCGPANLKQRRKSACFHTGRDKMESEAGRKLEIMEVYGLARSVWKSQCHTCLTQQPAVGPSVSLMRHLTNTHDDPCKSAKMYFTKKNKGRNSSSCLTLSLSRVPNGAAWVRHRLLQLGGLRGGAAAPVGGRGRQRDDVLRSAGGAERQHEPGLPASAQRIRPLHRVHEGEEVETPVIIKCWRFFFLTLYHLVISITLLKRWTQVTVTIKPHTLRKRCFEIDPLFYWLTFDPEWRKSHLHFCKCHILSWLRPWLSKSVSVQRSHKLSHRPAW